MILQDGKSSGHKTLLSLEAHIMPYAFRWMSFTLAPALPPLLQGYGGADPLIQMPWFIHFHCTTITLSVQICFFPHMRNDIVSRPELNCKLLSLPYPNQFVLFVNLTITKIQRSITQCLLISLFYFVPLIDTLQSSGLRQHNGSLETLSASQLGSWHLVTAPGCLFFLFRAKQLVSIWVCAGGRELAIELAVTPAAGAISRHQHWAKRHDR